MTGGMRKIGWGVFQSIPLWGSNSRCPVDKKARRMDPHSTSMETHHACHHRPSDYHRPLQATLLGPYRVRIDNLCPYTVVSRFCCTNSAQTIIKIGESTCLTLSDLCPRLERKVQTHKALHQFRVSNTRIDVDVLRPLI